MISRKKKGDVLDEYFIPISKEDPEEIIQTSYPIRHETYFSILLDEVRRRRIARRERRKAES